MQFIWYNGSNDFICIYYSTKIEKGKDMFSFLSEYFKKNNIDTFGWIPLCDCTVVRPYLLEKHGIGKSGSVCMLAIPYYTKRCDDPTKNLSAYAVSEDYHLYFKELFADLIPLLRKQFPEYCFAGFADHSPIAEVDAAARAGLGVIGKNHLLLTKKYSSYVFLGELITDAILPSSAKEIEFCQGCGICQEMCPMKEGSSCLSALTQKKGTLDIEEQKIILKHGSVWGCDLCQEACPYTVSARKNGTIYSQIPFFENKSIAHLTEESLCALDDDAFSKRAYSWRGRDTILRNLRLFEEFEKKKKNKEEFEC